mmetsp:Transcript_74379/g.188764  ORF Transcript_74379/g.188764 Transcript_74379/m.188764 type:complete len:257 (-) Transcript_74379:123-893(-)
MRRSSERSRRSWRYWQRAWLSGILLPECSPVPLSMPTTSSPRVRRPCSCSARRSSTLARPTWPLRSRSSRASPTACSGRGAPSPCAKPSKTPTWTTRRWRRTWAAGGRCSSSDTASCARAPAASRRVALPMSGSSRRCRRGCHSRSRPRPRPRSAPPVRRRRGGSRSPRCRCGLWRLRRCLVQGARRLPPTLCRRGRHRGAWSRTKLGASSRFTSRSLGRIRPGSRRWMCPLTMLARWYAWSSQLVAMLPELPPLH